MDEPPLFTIKPQAHVMDHHFLCDSHLRFVGGKNLNKEGKLKIVRENPHDFQSLYADFSID